MSNAISESLYFVVGPYISPILTLNRALCFDETWLAGLMSDVCVSLILASSPIFVHRRAIHPLT